MVEARHGSLDELVVVDHIDRGRPRGPESDEASPRSNAQLRCIVGQVDARHGVLNQAPGGAAKGAATSMTEDPRAKTA